MKNHHLILLIIVILSSCQADKDSQAPETYQQLVQGWQDPPLDARPKALWDWVDGNFELSEITRELEEAKDKGMAGFDIWDVWSVVDETNMMPDGPPFMSDEYVDGIAHAIREATRLDMELGLIIASGWNAGGSWVQPEHATVGQYRSSLQVQGPSKLEAKLPFPELPQQYGRWGEALIQRNADSLPVFRGEIAVLATPADSEVFSKDQIIDLSSELQPDGSLQWDVPKGKWKITRYLYTNTGQPMIAHAPNSTGPMLDHFNPEATEMHIRYFADKLKQEVGDFRETAFRYLYTDSYEVRGDLWTPQLPQIFQERIGYNMIPYLPALQGKIVINQETTDRFLFDYKKLLSDLIIEGHYAKAADICEEYGLKFAAEAGGPGPPVHNCPFESIKSSGVLDIPRGEFWHARQDRGDRKADQVQVIKGIACASHLYNRKYVEAEAFTSTQLWQEGPGDLKPTVDRFFCEGLNRIVFHTWPHTPEAAGKPGWHYAFGTVMNETRIWWPMAKAFMDYLSRCSFMLQEGHFVGDVLYYYGDRAPNFVGVKKIDPSLGFGYDYDVTNSEILLQLEVQEGKLVLPHGQQYSILVLPDERSMSPEVLKKIESLIMNGATVVGAKPEKSYSLNQAAENDLLVKQMAQRIWGEVDSINIKQRKLGKGAIVWGKSLRQVLLELNVQPDLRLFGTDSSQIDFIHRNKEDQVDAYFIRNKTDQYIDFEASFRVQGQQPEIWDPVKGNISAKQIFRMKEGRIRLPLKLPPYASTFLVFGQPISQPFYTEVWQNDHRIFPREDHQIRLTAVNGSGKAKQVYTFITNHGEKVEVPVGSLPSQTIKGPWQVQFTDPWQVTFSRQFDSLYSFTKSPEHQVKYFSGIATYEKNFEILAGFDPDKYQVILDLGEVAHVARVLLNGDTVETLWQKPYQLDISGPVQPGQNKLQVEIANLWPNRMIGDFQLPAEQRKVKSNVVRMPNGWSIPLQELPNQDYGLLPSGLMGPVKITYHRKMDLAI